MTQSPNETNKNAKYALVICGVEDTDLFQYLTNSERISIDVFDEYFESCMDKKSTKLDNNFK